MRTLLCFILLQLPICLFADPISSISGSWEQKLTEEEGEIALVYTFRKDGSATITSTVNGKSQGKTEHIYTLKKQRLHLYPKKGSLSEATGNHYRLINISSKSLTLELLNNNKKATGIKLILYKKNVDEK
ncbi:MAG: hypothetical protein PF637_09115 [Spirochaetes bacterium]|jgi:hypothetical protein|nr:hypothetical protein [Spirochaetota bacterium]